MQLICTILGKDGNYFFDFAETNLNEQEIKNVYGESSLNLLYNYSKLNQTGKRNADIYVEDLTKINEYTEKKQSHEANG